MKKRKSYKKLYEESKKKADELTALLADSTDLLFDYKFQMSAYTMADEVIRPQITKNKIALGD